MLDEIQDKIRHYWRNSMVLQKQAQSFSTPSHPKQMLSSPTDQLPQFTAAAQNMAALASTQVIGAAGESTPPAQPSSIQQLLAERHPKDMLDKAQTRLQVYDALKRALWWRELARQAGNTDEEEKARNVWRQAKKRMQELPPCELSQ